MRIAVDAMGGDQAPQVVVEGTMQAARRWPDLHLCLVGKQEEVRQVLAQQPAIPANLSVHHASQVAEMQDPPSQVLRRKPDASIRVALQLLKQGEVEAVVTAGNTGAAMATALFHLGKLGGISRPGLAIVLPALQEGLPTGRVILMDVGATVDCTPSQLCEFASMASVYAHRVLGEESPRVALLSNGEEEGKGNSIIKRTYERLQQLPLRFVGNVDAKDVMRGQAEVIICDGFVGNVWLKGAEAAAELVLMSLKNVLRAHWLLRLAGVLAYPALRRFRRSVDYREYGGALLLGVNGVVVISHGRSDAIAIQNAIREAREAVAHDLVVHLQEALAARLTAIGS